jgi:hypothetical protein
MYGIRIVPSAEIGSEKRKDEFELKFEETRDIEKLKRGSVFYILIVSPSQGGTE